MNKKKERLPVSTVEAVALQKSGRKFIYEPTEKIPVIEVGNYPELGRIAALRFIEWVQANPEGVVSLPVGKTPEHFIRYFSYYIKNWSTADVGRELKEFGIDSTRYPKMDMLQFVQSEEFYPINPQQSNSFRYFILKYYIREFGMNIKRALLMDAWNIGIPEHLTPDDVFENNIVDLTLRTRYGSTRSERLQKEVISQVDQYCTDYEVQVRERGGIGFYLGGIGPDGHICFNVRGSDHFSTTRLTSTNYETQAAAATDLGGIEVARKRLVITIGLSTLTQNPDTTAIIMAAGESHARVIKNSIECPANNLYPASALHKLPNARFFLTSGAASLLVERVYENVKALDPLPAQEIERIVVDLALDKNKKAEELNKADYESVRSSRWILSKTGQAPAGINRTVQKSLMRKIDRGLATIENDIFMHTAPHHDDIMLGYWASIIHLVRSPLNQHHFNYMTSGFNAVTNTFTAHLLENVVNHIDTPEFTQLLAQGYFDPDNTVGRNRDVYQYLDGVAAHSRSMKNEGLARRTLRNLMFIFEEDNIPQLRNRIAEMILYFKTQYPGKKDMHYIQQLKGMTREFEADLLWGYLGFHSAHVNHLRLGFYGSGLLGSTVDQNRDVETVLALMRRIQPTVVTCAFDPEGSGPGTHYKVLQTMAKAVRIYSQETGRSDIRIWGYRNVWFRFHPSEADIMVPVSLNSMANLEDSFRNCFVSQAEASFPSYELDGPFSRLSQRIMVEQYQMLKTCLGREFFNESEHPRLRATHGLVFIKEMGVDAFYESATKLRKSTEKIDSVPTAETDNESAENDES
ncbi:glucosamine-6-phosphate deaminase [candidate division KSB1 bacterium]|nr:glucosamine-6-phosphate deaminase [candidate division KSB1 bacterium]